MTPDPEKVRVWDARAVAYDGLCRRWEIFSLLSNRLIDLLPGDLHGPVLDVGAGTGLTSALLLDRHPRSEAVLVEPSQAMSLVARRNLAGRPAQVLAMGLDGAPVRSVRAVAALASASMQFVDLEPAFGTLAEVLTPGGHFAFNLWWHHWQETADRNCMTAEQGIVRAACAEFGLAPPAAPVPSAPAKSRSQLIHASSAHGFRLVAEHCDEFPTPVGFSLDFEAMDADWPGKGLSPELRHALLAKMNALAQGRAQTLVSTRFAFQRT